MLPGLISERRENTVFLNNVRPLDLMHQLLIKNKKKDLESGQFEF